jgi:hypothetical protein
MPENASLQVYLAALISNGFALIHSVHIGEALRISRTGDEKWREEWEMIPSARFFRCLEARLLPLALNFEGTQRLSLIRKI